MANPEHLEILKQGVEVWNNWREENKDIKPDLSNASNLDGKDFKGGNFKNVDLFHAQLKGSDFTDAIIRNTNLSGAYLNLAKISRAAISADFDHADLSGADFEDAIIVYSTFWETNLTGANFLGAKFSGNKISGVDLSNVKNLESVMHYSSSSIDIDTIYKSGGNIPEIFLRGCGVPDEFIAYMRSLVVHPLQFYSCFISYSSKNQDFAERLYADLQNNSVRCWLATEDLKIGDKFRFIIDESIRVHDKLLLVLSQHSVSSQWVEKEVETAMEREREENRTVLFPVRLDDAVVEIKSGWPADVRRTRHIGDFTRWKDHDSYQKAFDRLLRDLKAGE